MSTLIDFNSHGALIDFNSHGENTVSDNNDEELAKIDEWLKLNKLSLNEKKYKCMFLDSWVLQWINN